MGNIDSPSSIPEGEYQNIPSHPDGWTAHPEAKILVREGFQEEPEGSVRYEVQSDKGTETSYSIIKHLSERNLHFEPRLDNTDTKAQLTYVSTLLPSVIHKGDTFGFKRISADEIDIQYNGVSLYKIEYTEKK